jgi:hypothetical protein
MFVQLDDQCMTAKDFNELKSASKGFIFHLWMRSFGVDTNFISDKEK